jgi:predicted DsbA family dithiol-disulfide isomerase
MPVGEVPRFRKGGFSDKIKLMIQIDVFHDTVCPWCRIGKQHLKLALEQWPGETAEITYRTFFLDPNIPAEGRDFRAHMLAKGGGRVSLQQFFDPPRRLGEKSGLTFNFEKIEQAPNSLLSHRLIALTPPELKEAMIDAVYAAYFEDGRDIGSLDTLLEIAAEQGLDSAEMRRLLEGTAAEDEVLGEARWAQQQGISGVPFFIFNGRYAFSGAQPQEVILEVLEQVSEESENLIS